MVSGKQILKTLTVSISLFFNADSGNSVVTYQNFYEPFNIFGYFKNESDAIKAITLFGDEIKKLFVDCECD